tara:strand:- start:2906 stop:3256 length:351 start_codon:yes stop_codon:yes gene_type:complete
VLSWVEELYSATGMADRIFANIQGMEDFHKDLLDAMDDISRENVIIQRMLEEGLPLTREAYIQIFYDGKTPAPWTEKHEAILPPIFREDFENQREALKGFGEFIGVTFTGRLPSGD